MRKEEWQWRDRQQTDGRNREWEVRWDPTVIWQAPVPLRLKQQFFWRRRKRHPAANLTCHYWHGRDAEMLCVVVSFLSTVHKTMQDSSLWRENGNVWMSLAIKSCSTRYRFILIYLTSRVNLLFGRAWEGKPYLFPAALIHLYCWVEKLHIGVGWGLHCVFGLACICFISICTFFA